MSFTSLSFALFFSLVFALHWMLPHRFRYLLLLAANAVFYTAAGHPALCWALFVAALTSYGAGLGLTAAKTLYQKKLWLAGGILIPLLLLLFFKYTGFFLSVFSISAPAALFELIVPVGISYYTLQTISYLVDVYRGRLPAEKQFGYYLLYLTFFPLFLSGPIERAGSLLPQLKKERHFVYEEGLSGGVLLIIGLFQKNAVANVLANFIDKAFLHPNTVTGAALLLAVLLYSVQIYADFAAYSNMAVGLGKLLGISLTQNFKQPYFSFSMKEFWSRWHISLSTWLRDYIYIPLGGSRCSKLRHQINLLLTFLISGFWHGAGLCFLVWGLLHGLYLVFGGLTAPLRSRLWKLIHLREQGHFAHFVKMFWVFLLASFAWLFFRVGSLPPYGDSFAPALSTVFYILHRIVAEFSLSPVFFYNGLATLFFSPRFLLRILLLLCLFFGLEWLGRKKGPAQWILQQKLPLRLLILYMLLYCAVFVSGSGSSFLYFQF